MESEKKISTPKRKKAIPMTKNNSAEENILEITTAAKKFELDAFKVDLVGEVKPAAESENIETVSPKKKTTRKTKSAEILETVSETETQPRKRKTAVKDVSAAPEEPAKKLSLKITKKKSAAVADAISELKETPKKTRTLKKTKTLPQTESSLGSPKVAALETAPVVAPETEIVPPEQQSPIFKALAAPKLPALKPENRARLQMQSPTKIFFYWSLKTNPFETLNKIFGGRNANYQLIVKLQNKTAGTERIYPIEASGSAWFDVESDSSYRAEVGFFSAHHPFIRLLSSNTLETPRSEPSPFYALEPQFAVSSREFAEVLDVSGYKQDAFEMALAGDNAESSNKATFDAFEYLTGERGAEIKAAELRLVLFALASGVSLYDLRDQISPKLFALLEKLISENAVRLSAEKVASALEENFGFGSFETEEDETEITYSVFGASRINFQKFPKQFWKRFSPNSSLRLSS